jgi:hypothetical protein
MRLNREPKVMKNLMPRYSTPVGRLVCLTLCCALLAPCFPLNEIAAYTFANRSPLPVFGDPSGENLPDWMRRKMKAIRNRKPPNLFLPCCRIVRRMTLSAATALVWQHQATLLRPSLSQSQPMDRPLQRLLQSLSTRQRRTATELQTWLSFRTDSCYTKT